MEQSDAPSVRVIRVTGEEMKDCIEDLQRRLEAELDAGSSRIAVDMSSGVILCASSAGRLVRALRRAREAGGDLCLFSLPADWARYLRLTGLDRAFRVLGDERAAVDFLRK